ncbi:MAG: hypothetical protein RLZZ528_484 [Pseudomonadota bacterium]|jgi:fumarylpyruvate hydrolase
MTDFLFPPPEVPSLAVEGLPSRYPVRRIFCVGRNYAEHAAEMGNAVDRSAPFYFTKSPLHLAGAGAVPYAPGTADYQHEVELVVAIGVPVFRVDATQALDAAFGYAVGLDMTRRDLQAASKEKRQPWDTGKDVEGSAVVGALRPAAGFDPNGQSRLTLSVNGAPRQAGLLSDMVWRVDEIIAHLSTLYHLGPGDLILTGTPAGVGPVQRGDRLDAACDGLPGLSVTIA